jgi:hypothetical protein
MLIALAVFGAWRLMRRPLLASSVGPLAWNWERTQEMMSYLFGGVSRAGRATAGRTALVGDARLPRLLLSTPSKQPPPTFAPAYKTTNGGSTWVRWNRGMPESNFVKSMKGVDERGFGGVFWVFGGTYGRGVWKRDVAGTD